MMQELLLIQDNHVIVQSTTQVYDDSYETYLVDGGIPMPEGMFSIDYNKYTEHCWINGEAFQEYPNEYAESVLLLIETLIENKTNRIEQENEVAQQEYLKFENRKERALDYIVNDYHTALEKGFVRTSLGFDADISPDSVATLSATNLALNNNILAEEAPKTVFRDFYGLKRELDKVQVELLICQINLAQNHIRELKYTFKDKIKNTGDNDGLNLALEECVYSTLDFSNLADDGTPSVMPFEQVSTYVDRIDTRY